VPEGSMILVICFDKGAHKTARAFSLYFIVVQLARKRAFMMQK